LISLEPGRQIKLQLDRCRAGSRPEQEKRLRSAIVEKRQFAPLAIQTLAIRLRVSTPRSLPILAAMDSIEYHGYLTQDTIALFCAIGCLLDA